MKFVWWKRRRRTTTTWTKKNGKIWAVCLKTRLPRWMDWVLFVCSPFCSYFSSFVFVWHLTRMHRNGRTLEMVFAWSWRRFTTNRRLEYYVGMEFTRKSGFISFDSETKTKPFFLRILFLYSNFEHWAIWWRPFCDRIRSNGIVLLAVIDIKSMIHFFHNFKWRNAKWIGLEFIFLWVILKDEFKAWPHCDWLLRKLCWLHFEHHLQQAPVAAIRRMFRMFHPHVPSMGCSVRPICPCWWSSFGGVGDGCGGERGRVFVFLLIKLCSRNQFHVNYWIL